MRLTVFAPLVALVSVVLLALLFMPWDTVFFWASSTQRSFQDTMARAILSVQRGEPAAIIALCSATAAYGFVHALGPGHGKVLLGGAAVATGVTLRRMTALTVVASLAQSLAAIAVVGVFGFVLGIGSARLGAVADTWLASASAGAITLIGGYLVYRGVRLWRRPVSGNSCDQCGHSHGPSAKDVAALGSFRDAAWLVGSVAVRPCTGALFLMVIALRFDMFWTGCLAVLTMGLGTAGFNLIVTWSGMAARRLSAIEALSGDEARLVSGGLHIFGGGLITIFSLLWLVRFVTGAA
ncbi:MAG: hypothetical protein AAF965_08455 [Pseudomonadota bacterium]